MKYVAFLRGINISGKNKISMSEIKMAFLNLGYSNVITYLNSGNVLFESEKNDKSQLTIAIQEMINKIFGFLIPIFIIEFDELKAILSEAPNWWGQEDKEIYDNLIFIIPPTTFSEIYREIGEPKENFEKIKNYNNVIFWSFTRKDYQKTNWWSKTASSNIKDKITIRTANTIKKLFELK